MGIWKNFKHDKCELKEDIDVDILIIGGSLTGLLSAYYLKDKNVCIVESREIGSGTTMNTTAKITYLQERIYSKIKALNSSVTARYYLKSQLSAIEEYKKIITNENIDCDFMNTPSYLFASKNKEVKKLEKEVIFLQKNGIKIIKSPLDTKIKNYASYKVENTYTFNPLKFLQKIYLILKNNNIKIYENTTINKVIKDKNNYISLTSKQYKIKSKYVIFASSYPYFIYPLLMPLKTYNEKSYVIVSKTNEYKNISGINTSSPTYSFRYYKENDKNYFISLGSSHNTSFKMNDEKNFNNVKNMFKLKDENILLKYSTTDIITHDYIPYIGELKQNMFISCGYNTWGMTNSIMGAKIISDLITKKVNEYRDLFNPKRFNIANIIKLPIFIFNGLKSYMSSKLIKNKSWYKENIKIKNKIGVVTDELGKTHKIINKCPHAGCSLIWNEVEKTWDCPCHASRYDIDGNVIKGPSTKNIKF